MLASLQMRSVQIGASSNINSSINNNTLTSNSSNNNNNNMGATTMASSQAQNAMKKRRASVASDQPSSIMARLRQLEADMSRLDEDRIKTHDEMHTTMANYEVRLIEVQAIVRSRADNVEKYVGDMRTLIESKKEFEQKLKVLHDRHDRLEVKFVRREACISREIEMLRSKFAILERSDEFKNLEQEAINWKSQDRNVAAAATAATATTATVAAGVNNDLLQRHLNLDDNNIETVMHGSDSSHSSNHQTTGDTGMSHRATFLSSLLSLPRRLFQLSHSRESSARHGQQTAPTISYEHQLSPAMSRPVRSKTTSKIFAWLAKPQLTHVGGATQEATN